MQNNLQANIKAVSELIGYIFNDESLLGTALTHSSYCYENVMQYSENNERLEFLGDAIFDAIIGEALYMRQLESEEGSLSKLRAEIVCEDSLLRKADELEIHKYMMLGKGELRMASHGRSRALLADAMEAVIGAVYLDGGWEQAKRTVLSVFSDIIEDALSGKLNKDYKSELQINLQSDGKSHTIEYRTDMVAGPPHNRYFEVSVICDGEHFGKGAGSSKKQAEQNAACGALATLMSQR
ncbi:MAG: ribonuclease III [Anaerovoracaceae bacterium]